MAANKPAEIFPNWREQHIHTPDQYKYSSSRKWQGYTATQNKNFEVHVPVKSLVANISPVKNGVLLQFMESIGVFKIGKYMYISGVDVSSYKPGDMLDKDHNLGSTPLAIIAMHPSSTTIVNGPKDYTNLGTTDPTPIIGYSLGSRDATGAAPASTTGTNEPTTQTTPDGAGVDVGSIAKAAAFSTFFQMPGLFDTIESQALTGQRSLMNDQPLLPFIEQLCGACLRQFMSTPSGDFFAFYPDYFGGLGKTAYWLIEDIEIISGSIELSDDQLSTHVYVVGDIAGAPSGSYGGDGVVNMLDRINTGGVVTVFNAFMADFLNGTDQPAGSKVDKTQYPTLAEKGDAIRFLQKYGARPYYEAQATVRAPIYESFLAYQKFCLKWAEQFQTSFEFTFMPELFPGGIVAFPEHGLQCYVQSVTHDCSYENGFTTRAELMAPSAYKGSDGNSIDPDKAWVHAGMIRSWPTDANTAHFTGTTETDPALTKKPGTA